MGRTSNSIRAASSHLTSTILHIISLKSIELTSHNLVISTTTIHTTPNSQRLLTTARMYIKSIALLVALYGRGALAALPASCQAGDIVAGCTKCSPVGSEEYQPPGTGQVWYSQCCTESETATATGVTTSKQYCYSYELNGYPNNQLHGIKPACSKTGGGNTSWSHKGQCSTGGVSSIFYFYLLLFHLDVNLG